jgi:hypothetical protein
MLPTLGKAARKKARKALVSPQDWLAVHDGAVPPQRRGAAITGRTAASYVRLLERALEAAQGAVRQVERDRERQAAKRKAKV